MQPRRLFVFLVLLLTLLPSCTSSASGTAAVSFWTPTPTPFQPMPDTPTPTANPNALWISPAVPSALRQAAYGSGLSLADSSDIAAFRLDVLNPQSSISNLQSSIWIYALVAPFPTITDGVTADELRRAWAGEASVDTFVGVPFLMSESTLAAFTAKWGAPGSASALIVLEDQLLDTAWAERPSWAIVPFEALEPRWKVLTIDGQSPIRKEFDPASYPLVVTFGLQCTDPCSPSPFPSFPSTNRNQSKLTVLLMTGVTALVRATAWKMEIEGVTYPGRDMRDILRAADILHISNEIPFAPDCTYPNPNQGRLVFCSDPKYIALLEDVGADVIELTGNHFQDWGSKATLYTLEMYRQRGWPYYGGGTDLADSREPAIIEHNGNKLAFIGCNPSGPSFAWATDYQPGAAPCDDYAWMTAEIARLRAEGYLPIATFQYYEYYTPEPRPGQVKDFRLMADSGAVIVSGSQAHNAQAMEFYGGAFIHYGLGNLFFDQMYYTMPNGVVITDTRREFLDRHVFYDGRYISTELITAMLEDYSRPRPMTAAERADFLRFIFSASGW